jgi:hypothetical protein
VSSHYYIQNTIVQELLRLWSPWLFDCEDAVATILCNFGNSLPDDKQRPTRLKPWATMPRRTQLCQTYMKVKEQSHISSCYFRNIHHKSLQARFLNVNNNNTHRPSEAYIDNKFPIKISLLSLLLFPLWFWERYNRCNDLELIFIYVNLLAIVLTAG